MSLLYPSYEDLTAQITAEFRRQLPEVDPTVFGSWARAFRDGNAVLAQSISFLVRDLEQQLFPQTATGEFLDLWGGYEDLERKQESPASGLISITGTQGTVIPALTEFTGSNGITYRSTAATTVVIDQQWISSITRSGSIATASLDTKHRLVTGMTVNIAGADQPEYNGSFDVVVTSTTTFTYSVSGTPATPATGTPLYGTTVGEVDVEAASNGIATNLESGAQLRFVTAISGADSPATVQYDGLTGGAAEETDEDYRTRILLSRSIIEGVFTADQVQLAALSVAGNTRAFVKRPTLTVCTLGVGSALAPVPGQVSVFILRDNDPDILPSQGVLDDTKAAVIADGAMPSHTSEVDVFVEAPVLVETDFEFTALNPDTPTMQSAVQDQLKAFFEDSAGFEESVTEASYLGAIQSTQDLQTGAFMVSFELSSPSGDIVIGPGEIAALGDVVFSIVPVTT